MSEQHKILLDGYNLIFRIEKLASKAPHALEEARERLLAKLVSYRSTKRIAITVIFDGDESGITPSSYRKNGIAIIFSQPPMSADAVIRRMIQREENPKNLTVVTSDRAVADYAQAADCETLSSESFHQRLEKMTSDFNYEDKFNHQLRDNEVREWISLFEQKDS